MLQQWLRAASTDWAGYFAAQLCGDLFMLRFGQRTKPSLGHSAQPFHPPANTGLKTDYSPLLHLLQGDQCICTSVLLPVATSDNAGACFQLCASLCTLHLAVWCAADMWPSLLLPRVAAPAAACVTC